MKSALTIRNMVQTFEIGDRVLSSIDNQIHVIKEIPVTKTPLGWHAIVRFVDGGCGMVDSSGFTDLKKIEK